MAKLSAEGRRGLSKSSFAVPSKAPGSGSYPIPDESHARNALSRASGKPVEGQVRAAVHRKYPDIGKTSAHGGSDGYGPHSGMEAAMSTHADKEHPRGR